MQGPDYLEIYDTALAAIERGENVEFHQRAAVLALARAGATELALQKYSAFDLERFADEDTLSLKARLLKDVGLLRGTDHGRDVLLNSAEAYYQAYSLTGGMYSGINAATLFLLSGQAERAEHLARDILTASRDSPVDGTSEARYFQMATVAEAWLLTGREDAAKAALEKAVREDPDNHAAHATTLRQFEHILRFRGASSGWLQSFRPPAVAYYAGRIQGFGADSEGNEKRVRETARMAIGDGRFGIAYGALAAGSDIILAETFLEAGCALRVVLPCTVETFMACSVDPFGEAWRKRCLACLERAESVDIATNDASLMGRVAVQLAAELAMGRAVVSARRGATEAVQVLLAPSDSSHTQQSHETWRASGQNLKTLMLGEKIDWPSTARRPIGVLGDDPRRLVAMLFADFSGFGRLDDGQVATVVRHVQPGLAAELHARGDRLLHVNSWGDGIIAMFDSVPEAAEAAIAMQRFVRSLDLAAIGLPGSLALRVGGHYGPVTFAEDPLTGRTSPFGSQIAYAARIEPLAIPGSILVSDAFAARLALSPSPHLGASYVGRYRLSKMPGDARLYALTDKAGIEVTIPG